MDEMTILVPVMLKSKLTEALKTRLLAELEQNISRVEHDIAQLEFEGNARLNEQAKINVQAVAPLRAQIEAQKAQLTKLKVQHAVSMTKNIWKSSPSAQNCPAAR